MSAACCLGLLGRVGELHAAGLHPPAGEHLRLDDRRAADALGDRPRLGGVGREAEVRDRDARALDDLAGLVLEEAHGRGTLPARLCAEGGSHGLRTRDAGAGRRGRRCGSRATSPRTLAVGGHEPVAVGDRAPRSRDRPHVVRRCSPSHRDDPVSRSSPQVSQPTLEDRCLLRIAATAAARRRRACSPRTRRWMSSSSGVERSDATTCGAARCRRISDTTFVSSRYAQSSPNVDLARRSSVERIELQVVEARRRTSGTRETRRHAAGERRYSSARHDDHDLLAVTRARPADPPRACDARAR